MREKIKDCSEILLIYILILIVVPEIYILFALEQIIRFVFRKKVIFGIFKHLEEQLETERLYGEMQKPWVVEVVLVEKLEELGDPTEYNGFSSEVFNRN